MARIALFLVLVLATVGAAGFADEPQVDKGLVGVYRCEGKNPDGSSYEGYVEIANLDDTFRVRWTLTNETDVVGVGIYTGGVFAVSYFGGTPALAVYKVEANRLIGEWTMGGAEGAVYVETLTRLPEGVRPPPRQPRAPRRPARPGVTPNGTQRPV